MTNINPNLPIGVFDSGVGGLTVLHALQQKLPHESFIYLGDTARVPYGIKSPATVTRYAQQAANVLYQQGIKMLVIACNTASAFATDELRAHFNDIPIINVIDPGAQAACEQTKTDEVMVIATESTIQHEAYDTAIHRLRSDIEITSQSCSLFVALAEEGWVEGPIAEAVAKQYLHPLFNGNNPHNIDCLVLGCTHFPILYKAIRNIIDDKVAIIDSAHTTAELVASLLNENQWACSDNRANTRFLATDSPRRFAKVAQYFLGEALHQDQVELIDF